jgi:hypothetical protein
MASFAIGPSIMAVSCSTSQENNIIMLFWVDLLVTWVFSFTHVMSIGIIGKCSELTRIYWHTLIVHEHQNVPWKTSFHWSYTSSIHHLYILFNVYSDMPDTSTCPTCHRAGFFFRPGISMRIGSTCPCWTVQTKGTSSKSSYNRTTVPPKVSL